MTARPVLGIIACNRIVGIEPAQAVMERYIRAVMTYADVAALIIPSLADLMTADEVAPRLDGVLLTGSPSNIEGHRYAGELGEGPFDPGRDEIALSMVDRMIDRGRPVFGICRGFQEINVALGGSLRRDTSASGDLLPHHAPDGVPFDAMFDHLHDVRLTPGGLFANVFEKTELTVNSVHFQGVDRLADGLIIEAVASDGLIEAYAATINRAAVIAVQWHPEWQTERHKDSQTFFKLLGQTLRNAA